MKSKFRLSLVFGSTLVLLLLGLNGYLSYRAASLALENERRISHAHQVLAQIGAVYSTVRDVETGEAGYILTRPISRDSAQEFLNFYDAARAQYPRDLATLRALLAGEPEQLARLPLLEQKINARFETLRSIMDILQGRTAIPSRTEINEYANLGVTQSAEIRAAIATLNEAERQTLQPSIENSVHSRRNLAVTFLVANLAAAAFSIFAFWTVAYHLRARARAEAEREKLLRHAQAAQSEAEAANRSKDQFLATISHELRTPLQAMLSWASLLATKRLDEATTARGVDGILRNAKAQAQLIEDLLDVSRITSGKLRLEMRPCSTIAAINAALDSVRPAADNKGVRVLTKFDSAADQITADPNRLQQVVWNLLANAIKFTPQDGTVSINLDRQDSQARIVVSDTGRGISAEFLPFIFDRFRQSDSTTTRVHGGLGLGLAIARHLVEMHGGTISATSAGEGKGATFTVRLPLMPHLSPESPPARAPLFFNTKEPKVEKTFPELRGVRILAVDDERDIRETIKTVLELYGATVTTASSAPEAFALLQAHPPDVLLSDIGMPGEDGYSLIAKIRRLPPERGGSVPAIAFTGYARIEDRTRILEAGFQMFFSKPIESADLAQGIVNVLKNSRAG